MSTDRRGWVRAADAAFVDDGERVAVLALDALDPLGARVLTGSAAAIWRAVGVAGSEEAIAAVVARGRRRGRRHGDGGRARLSPRAGGAGTSRQELTSRAFSRRHSQLLGTVTLFGVGSTPGVVEKIASSRCPWPDSMVALTVSF